MIRYISVYDLMQDAKAAKAIREGDEEGLKSILWSIGFDTSKTIERQEVWHRPLTSDTNIPKFGMRFTGQERCDDDWKNSGNWSQDARYEYYRENDPELYLTLTQMSYIHNSTGELIDHIKNKGSFLDSRKRTSQDLTEEDKDVEYELR